MFSIVCIFTAISFYGYGLSCVFTGHMVSEFERYNLARFRKLTGYLQILGATGLFAGLVVSPVAGFVAASGLCLQMLLGFGVRLRIKDPVSQALPSFTYMWINGALAYHFLRMI